MYPFRTYGEYTFPLLPKELVWEPERPRKSLKKVSRGRRPPRESGKSLERVWRVWKKSRKGPERLFRDFFPDSREVPAGPPRGKFYFYCRLAVSERWWCVLFICLGQGKWAELRVGVKCAELFGKTKHREDGPLETMRHSESCF